MEAKEVLSEVARIAEKVVSSGDSIAPLILLELKGIYQQCPRSSLKVLKVHVWHYGLVHILIELLGQSFTSVSGQWATAAELASILSHSLTGLQPEKLKKSAKLDASQIEEYYDGVLPTAMHSLLVLANNLLTVNAPLLSNVLENITKLCLFHHILMVPLIQSPYLLHMIASSSENSLHLLLSFIKKVLTATPSIVPDLPLDMVHNYTDELAQKITTSTNPNPAIEVFGIFLETPNIAKSITNRYPGLKQYLISLFQAGNQITDIKWIIAKLGGDLDCAATIIQAHWRGHSARKKVKAIHRGIVAFQRLYRKMRSRRAEEEKIRYDLASDLEQENQQIAFRTFHEKQFKIIQQLPAKEVDSFLNHLQQSSATKIQRWWRNRKVNISQVAIEKPLNIQQNFSEHHGKESLLLFIDQTTREKLQEEISKYCRQHPVVHRSWISLQELHNEVQQQLQTMYLDRTLEKERNRKRKLLLNQLEVDSALLMDAPSLEKAQPNTIAHFTGSARGITNMAQLAHEEELKSLELPWWKRTNFDNEEIDLDD